MVGYICMQCFVQLNQQNRPRDGLSSAELERYNKQQIAEKYNRKSKYTF